MSRFHLIRFLILAGILILACGGASHAEQAGTPSRHIIAGVPFVRWSEAAGWNYHDKDIANPSIPAAYAMVLRYWGADPAIFERKGWDKELQGWHFSSAEARNLAEIKGFIDRDVPVIVMPAMTPFAHRVYAMLPMAAMLHKVKLKESRPGMLGSMATLDELEKVARKTGVSANDSVETSARVVIGYDQERKTVLLHDPSLGPVWEISERDFETMWQFSNRKYSVMYPPNYVDLVASKTSETARAARTPDNDAAAHYWRGYALESVDSLELAEQELRSGLQIAGISKGYAHLLHFELARVLNLRKRDQEAIAEDRKAIALMPDNPGPWRFLEDWARCCGGMDGKKEAAEAAMKAHWLCAPDAQTRFVRALAVDFDVYGCQGERLGWGLR